MSVDYLMSKVSSGSHAGIVTAAERNRVQSGWNAPPNTPQSPVSVSTSSDSTASGAHATTATATAITGNSDIPINAIQRSSRLGVHSMMQSVRDRMQQRASTMESNVFPTESVSITKNPVMVTEHRHDRSTAGTAKALVSTTCHPYNQDDNSTCSKTSRNKRNTESQDFPMAAEEQDLWMKLDLDETGDKLNVIPENLEFGHDSGTLYDGQCGRTSAVDDIIIDGGGICAAPQSPEGADEAPPVIPESQEQYWRAMEDGTQAYMDVDLAEQIHAASEAEGQEYDLFMEEEIHLLTQKHTDRTTSKMCQVFSASNRIDSNGATSHGDPFRDTAFTFGFQIPSLKRGINQAHEQASGSNDKRSKLEVSQIC